MAQTKDLIRARNGLKIQPDFDFKDDPHFDVLIVPGGYGADEIEIHNQDVIKFIIDCNNKVEIMAQ